MNECKRDTGLGWASSQQSLLDFRPSLLYVSKLSLQIRARLSFGERR
jgi:hypothetical protein